jgi:hypothetical protein
MGMVRNGVNQIAVDRRAENYGENRPKILSPCKLISLGITPAQKLLGWSPKTTFEQPSESSGARSKLVVTEGNRASPI